MLADITLALYFGASQARPSDLHVQQASRANDATFHSVVWRGYPFRASIYYGVRLTYARPDRPWTQLALDYTHFKVYADTTQNVLQNGVWHGATFAQTAPMQQRVQSFEITHGVNMLGLVLLQRVSGAGDAGAYAGAGPVIYLPHSESRVDGLPGGAGYQYGGGGFEVLAGMRGCVGAVSLFGELKYSNGVPNVTIAQGHAQTRIEAVHELVGIDSRRCPR